MPITSNGFFTYGTMSRPHRTECGKMKMRLTRKIFFTAGMVAVLIAALGVAGCASTEENTSPTSTDVTMDIVETNFVDVGEFENAELHVRGVTNLPDGTELTVRMKDDYVTGQIGRVELPDGYVEYTSDGIETVKYATVSEGEYSAVFYTVDILDGETVRVTTSADIDGATYQGNVVSVTQKLSE